MRFGAHFQHAFGQPILTADEPKSDQFRVLKQRVETRWGYTRNRYSPTSFMFTHITPSPERLWWKIELQCFWARHPFACDVRLKLEAFTIDALPFSLVTWFPLKAQIFKLTVRINVKASMRALQAVWRWSMGFRFAFNIWVPAKKTCDFVSFISCKALQFSFSFARNIHFLDFFTKLLLKTQRISISPTTCIARVLHCKSPEYPALCFYTWRQGAQSNSLTFTTSLPSDEIGNAVWV